MTSARCAVQAYKRSYAQVVVFDIGAPTKPVAAPAPVNELLDQLPILSKPTQIQCNKLNYVEALRKPAPPMKPASTTSSTCINNSTISASSVTEGSSATDTSTDTPWDAPAPSQLQTSAAEDEKLKCVLSQVFAERAEQTRELEEQRSFLLTHFMVDTVEAFQVFINELDKIEAYIPDLFLDAEGGNDHGRDGDLNFISIKQASTGESWLLDCRELPSDIFQIPATIGQKRTLQQILEDASIPKIWFDCRSDSDSIWGHYGIHMKGVIDLQLMELATRQGSRKHLNSLDRCISTLPLPGALMSVWQKVRNVGKETCKSPDGYGVFGIRPCPQVLIDYAINDASLMPVLFTHYSQDLKLCEDEELMKLILKVSEDRITASVKEDYVGNTGKAATIGPDELRALWPEPEPEWDSDEESMVSY